MNRYALLVAINQYQDSDFRELQFAESDATALAEIMHQKLGFQCCSLVGKEATKANIVDALKLVRPYFDKQKMRPEDLFLFFFAGHGQTVDREYVLHLHDSHPSDFESSMPLQVLTDAFEAYIPSSHCMCVLDACRSEMSDNGRGVQQIVMDAPTVRAVERLTESRKRKSIAVLFGCSEGQTSWEDPQLKHGVLTHHILTVLRDIDSLDDLDFQHLANLVGDKMHGWHHSKKAAISQLPSLYRPTNRTRIRLSPPEDVELPLGIRVRAIPAGEAVLGSEGSDERRGYLERDARRVFLEEFYMAVCPITCGQFFDYVEQNKHRWTRPILPATRTTEEIVTEMSLSYFNPHPSRVCEDLMRKSARLPMVGVSWEDAIAFCRWLSNQIQGSIDLPTEDQWEYACRAGSTTAFSFGNTLTSNMACINRGNDKSDFGEKLTPHINFSASNARNHLEEVMHYEANDCGLYDMHGSVFEWCKESIDFVQFLREKRPELPPKPHLAIEDTVKLNMRNEMSEDKQLRWLGDLTTGEDLCVAKGGCWALRAEHCRSAARFGFASTKRNGATGFRVVWTPRLARWSR